MDKGYIRPGMKITEWSSSPSNPGEESLSEDTPTTAPHNRTCGEIVALVIIAALSIPTAILYWMA
jgi:hypothetical protein